MARDKAKAELYVRAPVPARLLHRYASGPPIEGQESEAFGAIWGELLGDAYRELGRNAEAAEAYQNVMLSPMAQATVDPRLVQWKLLDLPAAETEASPEPEVAPADEPGDDEAVEEPGEEGSE